MKNEEEITLDEMSATLNEMLLAMLCFAGVKKDKLEDAADAYMDAIDEVFGDDDDGFLDMDSIMKVVEHLKKTDKELFN
ncbi:MAG: hypothetical protein RL154_706 [Pseudomonadota bacterium]|jgi:hypothetical protein